MALVLNDRVRETTTTTGTGAVALGGAVSGFETFAAGIGNSNTVYYAIVHRTAAEFEVGLGTLDGDSSDLTRTTVISSSNSDSAVNFASGTKDVFCTLPASKTVFEDASGHVTLPHDVRLRRKHSATLVSFTGNSFVACLQTKTDFTEHVPYAFRSVSYYSLLQRRLPTKAVF